jgi:hypothetical protein
VRLLLLCKVFARLVHVFGAISNSGSVCAAVSSHQTLCFVSTYNWQFSNTCGVSSPRRGGSFKSAFPNLPLNLIYLAFHLADQRLFLAGLDELVGLRHCYRLLYFLLGGTWPIILSFYTRRRRHYQHVSGEVGSPPVPLNVADDHTSSCYWQQREC